MFGVELENERCTINPVPSFLKARRQSGTLKESAPRTRYLTHEEEAALLAKCSKRIADYVGFAIDTGLKVKNSSRLNATRSTLIGVR